MNNLRRIPYYGSLALLAYMPFHIFLSQWLSTFTGGLDAWKIAKDVLTIGLVIISLGLVIWTKTYRRTPYLIFAGLAAAYLLLHVITYFFNQDTTFNIAALATVYNNRLIWFLIIGMSAVLLTPELISFRKITKLLLITSTIVVGLGLLQYLLPKDIMTHFGYAEARGVKPAFFIDDKPDLPRIMSTMRDPNSLGAYLIMPLTLLWAYLLDKRQQAKRLLVGGLFLLHGLALFLTFSRAAWAGAAVSLSVMFAIAHRQQLRPWLKRFWPAAAAVTVLALAGVYALRNEYVVQNIIFHSDETTVSELDSNEYHLLFAEKGLKGIAEQPAGHGPGTAGIVSIQNEGKGLLTENYFIQIGFEAGLLAVGLLLAILWMVERRLADSKYKLSLAWFAAFWAMLLMSLLSHLWTNEVVAIIWWLPAGMILAAGARKSDVVS